jgi:chaperonin GroEL
VSSNLEKMAQPVTSTADIEHIATISANNDSTIGHLIALAVDRVGQDGSITIEESRSHDTSLDVTEGFKINSGYCAGAFITDERRATMHHDDPLFLVTDHKINSVEQILPVLEMIARESRPLIIIAEDIDGQALAAMIMNAMRGTMKIAGIKAPAYGEERRETLADLALSVGATFVTRESGQKLSDIRMSHLGSAKFVEASKFSTTIVGGSCDFEAVETTISALKAQIEQTDDLKVCERMQDRIVRLSSGVAVINVGGSTEVEMTERKHRIEDALEAVRSGQEQGIVTGGGTALMRAASSLCIKADNNEQALGASVVKAACEEPIRQMALNAGLSPDLMVEKVSSTSQDEGVDFRTGELINMLEAGIIDPVKVTLTALTNAASCAGTLITTNYGIIQVE